MLACYKQHANTISILHRWNHSAFGKRTPVQVTLCTASSDCEGITQAMGYRSGFEHAVRIEPRKKTGVCLTCLGLYPCSNRKQCVWGSLQEVCCLLKSWVPECPLLSVSSLSPDRPRASLAWGGSCDAGGNSSSLRLLHKSGLLPPSSISMEVTREPFFGSLPEPGRVEGQERSGWKERGSITIKQNFLRPQPRDSNTMSVTKEARISSCMTIVIQEPSFPLL